MKRKIVFLLVSLIFSMQIFAYECWTETRRIPSNGMMFDDGACHMRVFLPDIPDGISQQEITNAKELFFNSVSDFSNLIISKLNIMSNAYNYGLSNCLIDMYMTYVYMSDGSWNLITLCDLLYLSSSSSASVRLVETVNEGGTTYSNIYTDFNSARADYDKQCNKFIALLDK